jgi:cell division septation protein DedD
MVPFEPKTDSKEFEIPNPERSPATGSRMAASAAADLTIRVWRRDGGGTAALTWQSESVLLYMIADLVAASHGRTAVEMPATMAAHFDNSLHALVAAKRIENAILEFLACRPGDYMGAAVLIHPPVAAGFSQGMAQSALRLAEPGQIILSEEVSQRFRDLPGIELRAVPALTTGGTEHAGLVELIWTSPERLASLRNSANVVPTTSEVGPPVRATLIVNSPLATPRSNTVSGSERIDTASRRPSAAEGFKNREGAFEEGLAEFEERRSFVTGSKMVVGAVVIVLVIVALVLFHPWSGSNVQPKSQTNETPAGTAPATTIDNPASSIPQPPPVVQPAPEQPVKPQPPPAKPPAKNKDKAKKPEDTPIQGFEGNSTYDGMTQKDIPRLLQWARSDAGNGNYAKAAQEYRVILQLQPYNSDAKEGLRKIQVAQQRNQ